MIVYKITNIINSKVYIGITVRNITTRWNEHIYISKTSNRKLYRSIRKYGIDSFTIEQIDKAVDIKELCDKEVQWIDFYKSHTEGYNTSAGGVYFEHSDETKELMSYLAKNRIIKNGHTRLGKKHSVEAKNKISIKAKERVGNKNPMFGKIHPNKGKSIVQPKFKCTYCGIESCAGMIGRWHNEKCKDKPCQISA